MHRIGEISRRWRRTATALWLAAGCCATALAQLRADQTPKELEGVGIEQNLGAQVDRALKFRDESGKEIALSDFVAGDLPVVLTLNYYRCSGLCSIQLNGVLDTLRAMKWSAGVEFRVVTVSFDPAEGPDLAAAKKESYVSYYDRPTGAAGWRFLTGSAESVKALANAVGFKYKWVEDQQQWAHDAAVIVLSPSGKISRYLGGVVYEPEVLRLSLVEASEGKVGSLWDRIFLNCFHYDPKLGKYRAAATMFMQLGGAVTVIVLGVTLLTLWMRDKARQREFALHAAALTPGGSAV